MASIFKKGGKRNRNGVYWVEYKDENGVRRRAKGCRDRDATELIAAELEKRVALIKAGVIDATEDRQAAEGRKPLEVHLDDWRQSLTDKGTSRAQARTARSRAARLFELGNMRRLADISVGRAENAVGALRDKGLSLKTVNYHVKMGKQFTRWLAHDNRTAKDLLAHLSAIDNADADRRRIRRALSADEGAWLIAAAQDGPTVLGLSGTDRAVLYQLALGSGLRANELRTLTRESFALDGNPPTVTVQAGHSKRRREDVQPLRRDLAETLRVWLADKPAGEPVFAVPHRSAVMLRADLEAARAAWIGQANDEAERRLRKESDFLKAEDRAGRCVDFHCTRHSYISALAMSNAPVKVVQTLARHSTPVLTFAVYSHVQLLDQAAALNALPATACVSEALTLNASKTGTDGQQQVSRYVSTQAASVGIGRQRSADPQANQAAHVEAVTPQKPARLASVESERQGMAEVARARVELATQGFSVLGAADAKTNESRDLGGQHDRAVVHRGACSAENAPLDPDLARVISRWETLPEPIRAAILALIESASRS